MQFDTEERRKGPGFMARVKERWDFEYPSRANKTAQNLCDNAKRFRKRSRLATSDHEETNRDRRQEQTAFHSKHHAVWTTAIKEKLVEIDTEERSKGRGFMSRIKERWDIEFPDHSHATQQKLRDNAGRFKKESEIMNSVLVRQRQDEDRMENQILEFENNSAA